MKKLYIIWLILSSFTILFLSTIVHSLYDIFPNFFTSLFLPINESIWEHNKMIVLAYFLFMILEKILFKKNNCCYILPAIFCSILVLIIYSPM